MFSTTPIVKPHLFLHNVTVKESGVGSGSLAGASIAGFALAGAGLHPGRAAPAEEGGLCGEAEVALHRGTSLFSTPKWGCCQTDCSPGSGSLPPRCCGHVLPFPSGDVSWPGASLVIAFVHREEN